MRIIRKLFYTTLTTFIILTIYTISNINSNVLRTNYEIEDITNIKTNTVYLLNKDNYLVKVNIFLDKDKPLKQVENIINYLKESNKKIISNYKGYIPNDTKILDIELKDKVLYLNLSEALKKNNYEITIPGLIKSLLELKEIDYISIKVNNEEIDGYNKLLDKNISINKEYNIEDRSNINKVVIYYFSNDKNYIPVTKYTSDKREKIEIIIDELKNTNTENLISFLNSNTELTEYKEDNNVMILNFNKYLIDDKNIVNYNLEEIANSVFANYDVLSVMFKVNGKNLDIINKK